MRSRTGQDWDPFMGIFFIAFTAKIHNCAPQLDRHFYSLTIFLGSIFIIIKFPLIERVEERGHEGADY